MNCIIVLSSVTYAMKAQKLLSQYRIYSALTKSIGNRDIRGCGYGLRITNSGCGRVQQILNENHISVVNTLEE